MKAILGIILFVVSLNTFAAGERNPSSKELFMGIGECSEKIDVDKHMQSLGITTDTPTIIMKKAEGRVI